MNKAYRIKLYPAEKQKELIDKTIGCARFIYNQMLAERIKVYEELKDDKKKLYSYRYKTEKDYKKEFDFLEEVSSYALQQSRIDLNTAYKNFYKRIKNKAKQVGFPRFKTKKLSKNSFRICQTSSNILLIKDNKIKVSKYGFIKFRGLNKDFQGVIKSITIEKRKDGNYFASILVERNKIKKERKSNNILGIDFRNRFRFKRVCYLF
jgi:putative transposase